MSREPDRATDPKERKTRCTTGATHASRGICLDGKSPGFYAKQDSEA